MPVDVRKVVLAAVEAALEPPDPPAPRKPRLTPGRALVLGAGLMTAGRLAAGARGRGMLESLHEYLGDGRDEEHYGEEDEDYAEEDEDYAEEDEDEDYEGEGQRDEEEPARSR